MLSLLTIHVERLALPTLIACRLFLLIITKTKPTCVSPCCKSHRYKTTKIEILSANSTNRS